MAQHATSSAIATSKCAMPSRHHIVNLDKRAIMLKDTSIACAGELNIGSLVIGASYQSEQVANG